MPSDYHKVILGKKTEEPVEIEMRAATFREERLLLSLFQQYKIDDPEGGVAYKEWILKNLCRHPNGNPITDKDIDALSLFHFVEVPDPKFRKRKSLRSSGWTVTDSPATNVSTGEAASSSATKTGG